MRAVSCQLSAVSYSGFVTSSPRSGRVVACILVFVMAWVLVTPVTALDIHVAITGNDTNPGTVKQPIATLQHARDLLRESGRLGQETCTVWVRAGVYTLTESFTLNIQDSGSEQQPVVYRAVDGQSVRLVGGRSLGPQDFAPVTDSATWTRVQPAVRGQIVALDLVKLGIRHMDAYPDKFTDNGGIIELFIDNQRMPVSRYPNTFGDMTMQRVLVNGGGQEKPGDWRVYYNTGTPEQRRALEKGPPRPGVFAYRPKHQAAHARWARALDRGVWLKGYWRVVWQNETVRVAGIDTDKQTVTLAVPVSNGIGSKYHRPEGSGEEIYWVMNLLEEVDRPGEWAIDFVDKKLYLYPPKDLNRSSVLISDMAAPVIDLREASHVQLQGLTVEGSLSDGIRISCGQSNTVLGCTVRNVAKYGVRVEGGSDHEVRSCDLYALGAGGVWLSGGDAVVTPRVPARHRVINNDIHHFGQIERVYAPGVNVGFIGGGGGSRRVDAVGMHVAHNAIHHCPHAGVLFNSFDNVLEYNEVFQFALVSNDMGAFYSYAKEDGIGNTTFRYNFMHSSPEGDGIYFDNLADRPCIFGNIAYRLGPQSSQLKAKRGCAYLIKNFGESPVDIQNNIAVDCKEGFFVRRGSPSTICSNVAVACIKASDDLPELTVYNMDPGFVDLAALNLALKPNAQVYRDVPDFKPIPFERIGLYADEFRHSVPDYRPGVALWQPGAKAAGYDIMDRE